MIVAICGPSGAGKTELQKELGRMGFKEIVSYTTRDPRPGEVNGVDYNFVSNEQFERMIDDGDFAEYEEYSHQRFYGTAVYDARRAASSNDNYAIVLTPNGIRAFEKVIYKDNLLTVMVTASLGERVKRYIDRCGEDFNFDDMNEINARVNRDFGMFLNMEKYVDMTFDNSIDARMSPKGFGIISKFAEEIDKEIKYRKLLKVQVKDDYSDYYDK